MLIGFWTALVATILSIFGHTTLAVRGSRVEKYKTLSQLAYLKPEYLRWFRTTMFVCNTLFFYAAFIILPPLLPRFTNWLSAFWALVAVGGYGLAIVPDTGKGWKMIVHNIFAYITFFGFLSVAVLFVVNSQKLPVFAWAILIIMSATAIMMHADRKRFIIYELIYIFLSHISVVLMLAEFKG